MSSELPSGELEWRDTYYILFQKAKRPTLSQVEAAISDATNRVSLENMDANDDGLFESILVQAPEDNAALEISFEAGEAVVEQCVQLAEQMQTDDGLTSEQLTELLAADARLDVMHFERVDDTAWADEEDEEGMLPDSLDPASLLTVVDALARLTGGLPIDPGSGVVMG